MDNQQALEKLIKEAKPLGTQAMVEAVERFIQAGGEHRARHGSSRHIVGKEYFERMRARAEYQLEEAQKVLIKYKGD